MAICSPCPLQEGTYARLCIKHAAVHIELGHDVREEGRRPKSPPGEQLASMLAEIREALSGLPTDEIEAIIGLVFAAFAPILAVVAKIDRDGALRAAETADLICQQRPGWTRQEALDLVCNMNGGGGSTWQMLSAVLGQIPTMFAATQR